MRRTSTALILLALCIADASVLKAQRPEPIATLPLSQLLLPDSDSNISGTVTFINESSMALSVCARVTPTNCSLSVIRWVDGQLRTVATTRDFDLAPETLHRAPFDAVLAARVPGKAVWYSPDLLSSRAAHPIHEISFSGKTSAQWTEGGWRLFSIDLPEPIRSGTGTILSVSDEFVVFQKRDGLHVETIQGIHTSLVKAQPQSKCPTEAQILPMARLYLDDCKAIRIVDFSGKTLLSLKRPNGWSPNVFERDRWSADGNRFLFNCWSRKVSLLRSAGELAIAVTTLGMGVGDEKDNREEIRVADVTTGRTCFELHRKFSMGSESAKRNAAISPSGQVVAVAVEGLLSVYRLPSVCTG